MPPNAPPVSICTTRTLVFRQVEKRHQRFVDVIRALQRTPHGDALIRIKRRDHPVIFDIELFLRAGRVFAFDDVDRHSSKRCPRRPFRTKNVLNVLSVAPDDFGLPFAFFDGENWRQRFVLDAKPPATAFGSSVAVRMRQQQNRLFRMIDRAIRKARLIVLDQRDVVFPGNIFRGDDDEFVPADSGPKDIL